MPRTAFFTKDDIALAGLAIVKRQGQDALTARALSKELGSSLSPIFTVYKDMEEIQTAVRAAAERMFLDYMGDVKEYFPAFKEFGLRLVRFSKEESMVFEMLFLGRDARPELAEELALECLKSEEYGLTEEQDTVLFRQMWPVAAGIAALCVKHPEDFSEEETGRILSNHFAGMMTIIKSGRQVENIVPQKKA